LGVDPHKDTHTVVAVDSTGRQLAQLTVAARSGGHLRLLEWAHGLDRGQPLRWAVEDCRHVAGGLLRDLIAAGEAVVLVPPKLMAACRASARTRGKSDPIDALAVARGALREPDLPQAHLDTDALEIRLLVDHRDNLVAERTQAINRLRWHLHDLNPDLVPPVRTMTRVHVLKRIGSALTALPPSVRRDLATELVERTLQLRDQVRRLERRLDERVQQLAPRLLAIPGVGPLTAAKIIGEVAGVSRFRTAAAFAMHAGAAPIPVWTGNRTRHRLNRGGNRQLNAALHRIAVTQARVHQPARDLLERRTRDHHDTKAGALRVLKRHLADVVYAALTADETARHTTQPTGLNTAA
jgi:transposase